MLILNLRFLILVLGLPSYFFLWPIMTIISFIFFLSSFNSFFISSLSYSQNFLLFDSISLFMVFLLFFIIFISFLGAMEFKITKSVTLVFFFLSFFCYQVFTTRHLFYLYFFYEASLVPILYIIIKWGSYPERSLRAIIILAYTLLFGAPVLILIIYLNSIRGTWFLSFFYRFNFSLLFSLLLFLCFSVKLPIYGLHF